MSDEVYSVAIGDKGQEILIRALHDQVVLSVVTKEGNLLMTTTLSADQADLLGNDILSVIEVERIANIQPSTIDLIAIMRRLFNVTDKIGGTE
jgi:hypothetical protein